LWRSAKLLSNKIKIARDETTGIIRVSLTWPIAQEGAYLVNSFIDYANFFIAEQEEKATHQKIARIEALIQKQELSKMKMILLQELESLQRSLVMEHLEINTAFKVLDPAYVPVEKHF
jgi:hypothetical protein